MTREELNLALATKRIILVDGDIDEDVVAAVKFWVLSFNLDSIEKEITLLIDCNGGPVPPTLAMYDLIKLSKAPVTGLVCGDCKSMAIVLLQACKTRLATQHSNFYIHELNWRPNDFMPLSKDSGKLMQEKIKELKHLRKKIIDIFKERSKLSVKVIEKLMRQGESNNTHLLAHQILELGLIDKIVETHPLF